MTPGPWRWHRNTNSNRLIGAPRWRRLVPANSPCRPPPLSLSFPVTSHSRLSLLETPRCSTRLPRDTARVRFAFSLLPVKRIFFLFCSLKLWIYRRPSKAESLGKNMFTPCLYIWRSQASSVTPDKHIFWCFSGQIAGLMGKCRSGSGKVVELL